LQLNSDDIEKLVDQHDKEAKAIKDELLKLCWYMRGGLTYSEAHLLTSEERSSIAKLIEHNLEMTKTSGLPFF
jgi:hypothetical protein